MKALPLSRKTKHILMALGLGLLCWLAGAVMEYPYTDTDSFWLSAVLNGMYSADTYTIFIHPWLCWFVGWLARLLPAADAYLLLGRIAILLAVIFLSYLILEREEDRLTRGAGLLLLAGGVLTMQMWNQNFTIQAAFFAAAACGAFGAAVFRTRLARAGWAAVGTVYACLALLWRWEAAALVLPFAALVLAARWLGEKGRRRAVLWTAVKLLGICVLCLAGLIVVRERIDARAIYRADYAYNAARSGIQDYPVRDWEEVKDQLPKEITTTDYIAMAWWVLFDTDHVTADTMREAAAIGSLREEAGPGLRAALGSILKDLAYGRERVPFLLLAAALLLIRLFRREGSVWYRVAGVLAPCGAALIIFYFVYTGHGPIRVWEAVLLGDLAALWLLNRFAGPVRAEPLRRRNDQAVILLAVFFLGNVFYFGSLHLPRLALTARVGQESGELETTFRGDDLYIWDSDQKVWYETVEQTYAADGKLMPPEFLAHNINTGSWMYGQHYYKEYLARLGAPNPAAALLFREHTYLVSNNIWIFQEQLRSHYGDVSARQVGELRGVPVWQFTRD